MKYTILGSKTSPFVRRIRMLLETIPYELKEMNIYETEDALALNKVNPVNQVPVLLDGDKAIWDSRVIFNYLNSIHKFMDLTWEDENTLTAIDGALSSGVALFLMKRSGMEISEPYMYVNRQKERMDSVIQYLTPYMEGKGLAEWNFITMSLYCFLDWASFRGILDITPYPAAKKFLDTHSARIVVKHTEIPKV